MAICKLTGEDGNAFAVMGRASRAMRRAKVSNDDITAYTDEATSGDYNHLLTTTMAHLDKHGIEWE